MQLGVLQSLDVDRAAAESLVSTRKLRWSAEASIPVSCGGP